MRNPEIVNRWGGAAIDARALPLLATALAAPPCIPSGAFPQVPVTNQSDVTVGLATPTSVTDPPPVNETTVPVVIELSV